MIIVIHVQYFFFFFFNDTATTEIYTLSLHDALPISQTGCRLVGACSRLTSSWRSRASCRHSSIWIRVSASASRSEEHTSELQSQSNLVCRLLLEKKKKIKITGNNNTDYYTLSSALSP